MVRLTHPHPHAVKTFSNWPTIPQLYVDGEFLGGCDIMVEMFEVSCGLNPPGSPPPSPPMIPVRARQRPTPTHPGLCPPPRSRASSRGPSTRPRPRSDSAFGFMRAAQGSLGGGERGRRVRVSAVLGASSRPKSPTSLRSNTPLALRSVARSLYFVTLLRTARPLSSHVPLPDPGLRLRPCPPSPPW